MKAGHVGWSAARIVLVLSPLVENRREQHIVKFECNDLECALIGSVKCNKMKAHCTSFNWCCKYTRAFLICRLADQQVS